MAIDNADYAKIKDDISTLKNDLASILKLFEKEGISHVKDALSSAKESIKGSCDIHKMEECIKKNPKESIAVAVVAGLLLACLLGRK
jgi:ElaB/YqjD/DUF883 family membrane-anchored ribosome-binding protein